MNKKAFSYIFLFIYIITFISCGKNADINDDKSEYTLITPTPVNQSISSETGNNSYTAADAADNNLFTSHHYKSFHEFIIGLRDFDTEDLEIISNIEESDINKKINNTYVTKNENKYGIFNNVRLVILKNKSLLLPYYKGDTVYNTDIVNLPFIFDESAYCDKPRIWYRGVINNQVMIFYIMIFDQPLVHEANRYGASWLINKLSPTALNVHTYKNYYKNETFMYNKQIKLGDRDANAMIIDRNKTGSTRIGIYFVYENMLVGIFEEAELIYSILPNLTFHEVSLLSGKPLRETPGRYGTPYSTREYRLAEGVILHTYEDELAFYEQYGIVNEDVADEN
ncbi:MAG: hypothetical protein FWE82_04040 [Defluviitaleaceae bacterium]|nr:hypothetical protein [Defluviitaleaceae bacterium]